VHTQKKAHREFEEQIRGIGCPVTSVLNPTELEVHHLKGRTFKHNKQLIGPWLCVALYQPCKLPDRRNLHRYGKNSVHDYSDIPFSHCYDIKDLTKQVLDDYILYYHIINSDCVAHNAPWTYDEWLAIEDYLK
jgi:hypothetical protein